MRAALQDRLAGLGLEPSSDKLDLLGTYLTELQLWNKRTGLVEASEADELLDHIEDCAAGVPVFLQAIRRWSGLRHEGGSRPLVLDLGSGAGLPGLVLSILLPEASWVLVEKSARRAAFLRTCRSILGAGLFSLEEVDFSRIPPASADIVTNRAFRNLDSDSLAQQLRLLAPGGQLILYKGRREQIDLELESALGAASTHGASGQHVDVIRVRENRADLQRHMLCIRPL